MVNHRDAVRGTSADGSAWVLQCGIMRVFYPHPTPPKTKRLIWEQKTTDLGVEWCVEWESAVSRDAEYDRDSSKRHKKY